MSLYRNLTILMSIIAAPLALTAALQPAAVQRPASSTANSGTVNSGAPTISENYSFKSNYYISLDDDSSYILKKVVISKAAHWFESDVYGNPAAHWMKGDRVIVNRTGDFSFPFQLINLETNEEAFGSYINPHMEGVENIHVMFEQLIKENQVIRKKLDEVASELRRKKQ